MTVYDNTNRGVLFKNNQKKTDKHPDYTGKIDVDGTEFRLSAWIKVDRNGNKYMSLAVSQQEADAQAQPRGKAKAEAPPFDPDDPLF